jgi:hypothetical protein
LPQGLGTGRIREQEALSKDDPVAVLVSAGGRGSGRFWYDNCRFLLYV